MGQYFSDVVEQAIEDLYYCYDAARAAAAADALFAAAQAGDGDACYVLSRCCSGTCYSWDCHPFKEDTAAAYALLHRGVSLGSAVAVLGALRIDMLTPELRQQMPFANLHEAWAAVYEKAAAGCLFCQYMIGNTYYFLDVIEIEDRRASEFATRDAWDNWRREQMAQSLPWFEKAFAGGMGLAGRNLYQYYLFGRGALVPPDPARAQAIRRQGAKLGYPDWMYSYALYLYDEAGQKQAGLDLARQAAQRGQLNAWNIVGDAYFAGRVVPRDPAYALQCYQKATACNDAYAHVSVGALYFRGEGTAQDYAKAVQYLERAYALDEKHQSGAAMLGVCYLLGYGCRPDYGRAKALLERAQNSCYKNYGLGLLYAEGLGVPEDIAKGVEFLQAAGSYPPAQEALKRYKKSLFGVWRRRG